MSKVSSDGLVEDFRDGSFVELYEKAKSEQEEYLSELKNKLRSIGVKAAHPNDGWNERQKSYFGMSYPLFDDGVTVGDTVALYDLYGNFVVVKVTKIHGIFFKRYEYRGYK